MGVRISRIAAALVLVALPLLSACSRGAHPTQLDIPAPDFTIHDGGQTVSLDQYRGKVVVLNFWASWCIYCAAEWPSLEQIQQQIPNSVVLAVAFDSDPSDYRHYIIENRLHNMTVVLDPTDKSNLAFGTTRPPETYVIDRKGIIRRKFVGAQDWSSAEIRGFLKSL